MNVIDKAIERLSGRWCKAQWLSDDGNVCLSGALKEVSRNERDVVNPVQYEALKALVVDTILAEDLCPTWRLKPGGGMILWFNDDPSTTEEDVTLLMKKASARLDEEAGA